MRRPLLHSDLALASRRACLFFGLTLITTTLACGDGGGGKPADTTTPPADTTSDATNFDIPVAVDCTVSAWSDWGPCSETCDGGMRERTRVVESPASNGGAECPELTESEPCGLTPCDMDCVLSEWSEWGPCEPACGYGLQERTRTIVSEPIGEGAACDVLQQEQSCDGPPCFTAEYREIKTIGSTSFGIAVPIAESGAPVVIHQNKNRWKLSEETAEGELNGVITLDSGTYYALQVMPGTTDIVLVPGGSGSIWKVRVIGDSRYIWLAGPVSCGGHTAPTCEACPEGNGAAWCNGECQWDAEGGQCLGIKDVGIGIYGGITNGTKLFLTTSPTPWFW